MYVTTIGIDGMMCGQCESHVSELLRQIEGALLVSASHFKNQAEVLSPAPISKEEVEKALDGSGYRVLSYQSEEEAKEPFRYRMKLKSHQKKMSKQG